jgi:hypothetical protein
MGETRHDPKTVKTFSLPTNAFRVGAETTRKAGTREDFDDRIVL